MFLNHLLQKHYVYKSLIQILILSVCFYTLRHFIFVSHKQILLSNYSLWYNALERNMLSDHSKIDWFTTVSDIDLNLKTVKVSRTFIQTVNSNTFELCILQTDKNTTLAVT